MCDEAGMWLRCKERVQVQEEERGLGEPQSCPQESGLGLSQAQGDWERAQVSDRDSLCGERGGASGKLRCENDFNAADPGAPVCRGKWPRWRALWGHEPRGRTPSDWSESRVAQPGQPCWCMAHTVLGSNLS